MGFIVKVVFISEKDAVRLKVDENYKKNVFMMSSKMNGICIVALCR